MNERTYRRYERGEVNRGDIEPSRADQFENLRCIAAVYDLAGPEVLVAASSPIPQPSQPPPQGPGLGPGSLQAPDSSFHPGWYVHREIAEKRALQRLRDAGSPVVLQGPWLYGKGTSLGYLLHRMMQPEAPGSGANLLLRVNLATLEPACLGSLDALLHRLAQLLLARVEQGRADDALAAAWQRPGNEKGKLSRILAQRVLSRHVLCLALERAERLHNTPFQDDFFALLRGWAESASQEPWSRLRLIVTVSTEPTLLDNIDHSSFFAMANPIELSDMNRGQAEQLAALHGLKPPPSAMERLIALVGGHPYLLRLVFFEAALREVSLDELLDGLEPSARIFDQHLRRLRTWLEGSRLLPVLAGVLDDPGGPLSLEDYGQLYSHGLVREDQAGIYQVRCKLYEEYFKALCRKR